MHKTDFMRQTTHMFAVYLSIHGMNDAVTFEENLVNYASEKTKSQLIIYLLFAIDGDWYSGEHSFTEQHP